MKVIPIKGNHKAIRNALDTARQAVLDGELVCIFAEGVLTRSGQLQTFSGGS
jgi:acyl-[acyl-carrier-protein]-phospholipid O-acyltransferase/long-chain-fatty-acid--[acyl-carrier-protein] ligase